MRSVFSFFPELSGAGQDIFSRIFARHRLKKGNCYEKIYFLLLEEGPLRSFLVRWIVLLIFSRSHC